MSKNSISVVISIFNEVENIDRLYIELTKVTSKLNLSFVEIIFVNDGSTDNSKCKILDLQKNDPNIILVDLKRNFGHEVAMTAGMDVSKGDAVIFMDADLQHPPKYIIEMVDKWKNCANIVLTKRMDNKGSSKIYKFCACIFYKILNILSDVKIPEKSPDFRLLDRKYVDFLKNFNERDRMFRGLLSLILPNDGVEIIEFVAPERFAGQSKYNFSRSLKLALNAMVQFSIRPLRLSIYLGIVAAFISILMGVYVIGEYIMGTRRVPGYATMMTTITFMSAVQLIVMGIIGEYVGKIHMEVKKRPLYFAETIKAGENEDDNCKCR